MRPGAWVGGSRPRVWSWDTRIVVTLAGLAVVGWYLAAHPALDESVRSFALGTDFRAYYTAGQMLLGGVSAGFYDLGVQYRWQRSFAPELGDPKYLLAYLYPPFAALPFAALARLPLASAYAVWISIELAQAVIIMQLLGRIARWPIGGLHRGALIGSALFLPLGIAVLQGQLSLVLTIGLLASWWALGKGREGRGGIWLGCLLIKPQLLLLPTLVLLAHRRWRALGGLTAASLGALLVSAVIVGPGGLLGYLRLLLAIPSWGDAYGVHPRAMFTWRGSLDRLLATDGSALVDLGWAHGATAAVAAVWWIWRGQWSPASPHFDLQWAALVLATLFTSPHGNSHDLSLLLVPGTLAIRYLQSSQSATRLRAGWSVGYVALIIVVDAALLRDPGRAADLVVGLTGVALAAIGVAASRWHAVPRLSSGSKIGGSRS